MNSKLPILQIRVHKLDRSVSTFVQNDLEKSTQILDGFNPMDVFARPRIILGDRNSHTVISVPQITRIDLEMNHQESPLIFHAELVEGVELIPSEFEALIQNMERHDQWKHLGELDAFVVTFLNLEMADGRTVLMTMEVDSLSPQGLCELRDFLLSRPGLCFRASGGGISALNMANVSSLTIFPGAHQPQENAWEVRRSDEEQSENPAGSIIPEVESSPCPAPSSSGSARGLRIKRL